METAPAHGGISVPSGELGLQVIRGLPNRWPDHELSAAEILTLGAPQAGLSEAVNRWRRSNLANLMRGLRTLVPARALGIPTMFGELFLSVFRGDGRVEDLGLASLRVVTDAGVAYLAACMDNTNEPEVFKYHGFGTGTGAEAAGDTALGTELTTQYAVDNTRPTGSQAHATNTYTTVATVSPDSGGTIAVTEHGVFSAASAGTLLDRSKFAAVNLVAGSDSLQATYVFTLASGG